MRCSTRSVAHPMMAASIGLCLSGCALFQSPPATEPQIVRVPAVCPLPPPTLAPRPEPVHPDRTYRDALILRDLYREWGRAAEADKAAAIDALQGDAGGAP